jgi:hypothetical protein
VSRDDKYVVRYIVLLYVPVTVAHPPFDLFFDGAAAAGARPARRS